MINSVKSLIKADSKSNGKRLVGLSPLGSRNGKGSGNLGVKMNDDRSSKRLIERVERAIITQQNK